MLTPLKILAIIAGGVILAAGLTHFAQLALAKETYKWMDDAMDAYQNQSLSYSWWNHQLQDPHPRKANRKR